MHSYLEACRTNEKVREKNNKKTICIFFHTEIKKAKRNKLRPRARAKYGNRHMIGFVLSHERKRGIDPPTRKTQLSIISETGTGAPDRQFDL